MFQTFRLRREKQGRYSVQMGQNALSRLRYVSQRARSVGLIRIRKTHPSTTLIRWGEMRWAALRDRSIGIRMRESSNPFDLWLMYTTPCGAFSREPRGCQAHPNQGVVKYHTLRLPDPNSSVNFSDEPDELGWLIRIWMSPIERLIRKRRSPPNPDEPNRTRPKKLIHV